MSEVREAFELIFKVPDDVVWSGNCYLPKGEQPYAFESMDRACEMDSRLEGYDAAQSELAALREELAKVTEQSNWRGEMAASNCRQHDAQLVISHKLRLRLTAAEQRNAVAAEVFAELRDNPAIWVRTSSDAAGKINEFLKAKPTELGASE